MPAIAVASNLPDWDYFERFYCISLADRGDRRRQAINQFRKVGLAGRVEFVIAERHPHDSERGIYESHMVCIARGLASGAARMVIFEDDVVFDRFSSARLKACVAFLAARPEWRLFFFGCLVRRSARTDSSAVVSIVYRCLAHAYALNRPAAEQLVTTPWNGVAVDIALRRFTDQSYAAYPAFAFQADLLSDNRRRHRLDSFRRYCGGLQRIQKANEWYHRHRRLVLVLHLVGFAAAAGLVRWLAA